MDRILKRGGCFAAIGYFPGRFEDQYAKANQVLKNYFEITLGPFQSSQTAIIMNRFSSVPFSYKDSLERYDDLVSVREMTLGDFWLYTQTWSASVRCKEKNGDRVFDDFLKELMEAFGTKDLDQKIKVLYDLFLVMTQKN